MKIFVNILHLIVLLIDPVLIGLIFVIFTSGHGWLSFFLFLGVHFAQLQTGGWFFAWKKENRDAFNRNWFQNFEK